jgi:beta-N-acetylhexosaminidase
MFILGMGKLDYPLEENLGGVIFFTKDIQSKTQFQGLIKELSSKSKTPLFFSIDQEGGRVERTENIHARYLSPMHAYQKGDEFLKSQTSKIVLELKDYGINMNFAPCLDVNSNPNNPIIGERAFSDKPDEVKHAYDIVKPIYDSNKMISVIKHFPGHGDASKDSHKELPVIDLPFEEMEKTHISPFIHAIEKGADAIMVAHLHCTCFDKNQIPTSLSKNCLGYIRNTLNYDGVLISDDMVMAGVGEYSPAEACIMGIKAGLDMFIFRCADDKTIECMERVFEVAQKDYELAKRIEISYNRIVELKRKYNIISQ